MKSKAKELETKSPPHSAGDGPKLAGIAGFCDGLI